MGVRRAAGLPDGAQDVGLELVGADLAGRGPAAVRLVGGGGVAHGPAVGGVGVDGVAHGLAVDGDGVVVGAVVGVEALQGAVELVGTDAHQHIADDELAGHLVAAAAAPAAEPLAGARGQVGGPLGHGLVAAGAAQGGAGGDGEHDVQRMAQTLAPARVVDVEEVLGKGTHGVGGEHAFGTSVSVGGKQRGARQARPRVGNEGTDEDQLGGAVRRAVAAAHAAEAARAADAGPVRGAVRGAAEARRVDERLEQQQRMAEAFRPVRRRPPRAQRQHARRQVRHPRPRQHQEAAVVGEQVLAVMLGAEVPADPAVAGGALQRRRREARQRHPGAAPRCRVPARLADLRQRAQVVVRLHQALVARLVPGRHRLHGHLAELHATPGFVQNRGLSTPLRRRCPAWPRNPILQLGLPGWDKPVLAGCRVRAPEIREPGIPRDRVRYPPARVCGLE